MVQVAFEHVTKTFRVSGDFISRRFSGGSKKPVPEEAADEPPQPGSLVKALDDLNLIVEHGETMSVVGPSGSGKSTLLRVVAGLEQPDAGLVLYDGSDMADVPPKDRGIGMVFQNYALYPHMDSRVNVGFFLLVRKRKQEIPERVHITSEIMGVGFDQLLDRRPKELSGGQQQRVAIARCIARDPKLFLLDEPLSSLDAKLRVRTRVEIKRLLRRFAITTLYVTHDQTEAIALGDRIAVMNSGRIEQVGRYRDIYDSPANLFVGSFVGTPPMNILPGVADLHGGVLQVGPFAIPMPPGWSVPASGDILIGIRPEHVSLDAASPHLRLAVEVVEPLIQERMQQVHGAVDGQRFVAKLSDQEEIRSGEVLPIAIEMSRVHLFDAHTETRLEQR